MIDVTQKREGWVDCIYLDHKKVLTRYMSLFADDAKLLRKIKSKEDCEHLQKDLDKIHRWNKLWEMELNAKKCKVLEIGCSRMRQRGKHSMGN